MIRCRGDLWEEIGEGGRPGRSAGLISEALRERPWGRRRLTSVKTSRKLMRKGEVILADPIPGT